MEHRTIKYCFKRREFFIVQGSIVHPLTRYCGWTVQKFMFFQFDSQNSFFFYLVIIEDQFILFSLKGGAKRKGTGMKKASDMDDMS
jgi:hypothetical protein